MVTNLAQAPVFDDQETASEHFLTCLKFADHKTVPYDYWLLNNVLPARLITQLAGLPFTPPSHSVFNGRRESNNSTRVYFTPDNRERFPACRAVVDVFNDPAVIGYLQKTTRADLSIGQLRIEYCQDIDGFWLEPHLDISVKLFTMLVYLSDDPDLADAGTDIYDDSPEHKLVATAPYQINTGLIFIPGAKTWHGFTKRPIRGLRKSIIINYVAPEWLSKEELAYA